MFPSIIFTLGLILCFLLSGSVFFRPAPKIVVTLFAKNEGILLQHWIQYYSRLFSPQQLLIFDNFSNDNFTLALLRNVSMLGAKVLLEQGPYKWKGALQLNAARQYFPHANIFIPLDCDEFIVPVDNLGMPYVNLNHVRSQISYFHHNRLSSNISCWGLEQQFDLLITSLAKPFWHETQYYPVNVSFAMSKKIFHLKDVISVNHGHHHGKIRNGTVCASALGRVGIVHYHNRGPLETVSRALMDMQGFGYLPANTTLLTLPQQRSAIIDIIALRRPGRHKARELLAYLEKGTKGLLSAKKERSFEFSSLHSLVFN